MASNEINARESSAAAVAVQADELLDQTITCIDCQNDFVWSVGEQAFFRDKKLDNPPKRCKNCKKAKNDRLSAMANAQRAGIKQRIEVLVKCARCSESTSVPFYPSQGRPVYCRSCYLELNPSVLNGNKHSE